MQRNSTRLKELIHAKPRYKDADDLAADDLVYLKGCIFQIIQAGKVKVTAVSVSWNEAVQCFSPNAWYKAGNRPRSFFDGFIHLDADLACHLSIALQCLRYAYTMDMRAHHLCPKDHASYQRACDRLARCLLERKNPVSFSRADRDHFFRSLVKMRDEGMFTDNWQSFPLSHITSNMSHRELVWYARMSGPTVAKTRGLDFRLEEHAGVYVMMVRLLPPEMQLSEADLAAETAAERGGLRGPRSPKRRRVVRTLIE